MNSYELPYGNSVLRFDLPPHYHVDIVKPNNMVPSAPAADLVESAVKNPLANIDPFVNINANSRVVITINDKTRPVPNNVLVPPLLRQLHEHGVKKENILFLVASGTHVPMPASEFDTILSSDITSQYRVIAHDCDDAKHLKFLGTTPAGTPVYINQQFFNAELRIVVGDIEPHHFAGYSGGVKSAAIGLCGRETINSNHTLLLDDRSIVGSYEDNPLRQDIEFIGSMIGVHLCLNAVLNEQKEIVGVFFGKPIDVMQVGIQLVKKISQIDIQSKSNVVIASAGGYPKDINLYQSQKAMTHASLFCREGGTILLAAECREGAGSTGYLDFMKGIRSSKEIEAKFKKQGFSVGPHKAFQIARILEKYQVCLHSSMSNDLVRSLFLFPIDMRKPNFYQSIPGSQHCDNILVLPFATACIPQLDLEGLR